LLRAHLLLAVLLEDLVVSPQHLLALGVEPETLDQHSREKGHRDDGERRQPAQYVL
jgi:hypothetical protein